MMRVWFHGLDQASSPDSVGLSRGGLAAIRMAIALAIGCTRGDLQMPALGRVKRTNLYTSLSGFSVGSSTVSGSPALLMRSVAQVGPSGASLQAE